ncbi:hypothetical protein [Planctomycetes bacterium K23_9]|uniref:Uncharacterized protein n=1 Tax=Stieleria marina TaxID=1930275 RepID=A0A517NTQ4_9BACT|nr:hypothetical protein K239x_24570 [Planctomycetes bacterium K23_9]
MIQPPPLRNSLTYLDLLAVDTHDMLESTSIVVVDANALQMRRTMPFTRSTASGFYEWKIKPPYSVMADVPRAIFVVPSSANTATMNPKRWRLVRNLAFCAALVVTTIQLYFVVPIFLDLFNRLPAPNNPNPPAGDPSNESRLLTAMVLQTIGLPSWVIAFIGWRVGRRTDRTLDSD